MARQRGLITLLFIAFAVAAGQARAKCMSMRMSTVPRKGARKVPTNVKLFIALMGYEKPMALKLFKGARLSSGRHSVPLSVRVLKSSKHSFRMVYLVLAPKGSLRARRKYRLKRVPLGDPNLFPYTQPVDIGYHFTTGAGPDRTAPSRPERPTTTGRKYRVYRCFGHVSDVVDYRPLKVTGLRDNRTPAAELRFQLDVTSVFVRRTFKYRLFTATSSKPGVVILGKTACGGVIHGVGGDPITVRVRAIDYAGNIGPPSRPLIIGSRSKGKAGIARGTGDRDGDRVMDSMDRCPDLPGTKARKGCPKVVLAKVKGVRIVTTGKIRFQSGKAVILRGSYPLLDQVASILTSRRRIRIRIENHSGHRGSRAFNLKMTGRRARAVRDYLVRRGIGTRRLSAVGYGFSKPRYLCVHNPKAGRSLYRLNTRTEFHILPRTKKAGP